MLAVGRMLIFLYVIQLSRIYLYNTYNNKPGKALSKFNMSSRNPKAEYVLWENKSKNISKTISLVKALYHILEFNINGKCVRLDRKDSQTPHKKKLPKQS